MFFSMFFFMHLHLETTLMFQKVSSPERTPSKNFFWKSWAPPNSSVSKSEFSDPKLLTPQLHLSQVPRCWDIILVHKDLAKEGRRWLVVGDHGFLYVSTSLQPTNQPTKQPTNQPTNQPTHLFWFFVDSQDFYSKDSGKFANIWFSQKMSSNLS